jgi:hypothetical protein
MAATEKLAAPPMVAACDTGCVTMTGGVRTVRVAALLVVLP